MFNRVIIVKRHGQGSRTETLVVKRALRLADDHIQNVGVADDIRNLDAVDAAGIAQDEDVFSLVVSILPLVELGSRRYVLLVIPFLMNVLAVFYVIVGADCLRSPRRHLVTGIRPTPFAGIYNDGIAQRAGSEMPEIPSRTSDNARNYDTLAFAKFPNCLVVTVLSFFTPLKAPATGTPLNCQLST